MSILYFCVYLHPLKQLARYHSLLQLYIIGIPVTYTALNTIRKSRNEPFCFSMLKRKTGVCVCLEHVRTIFIRANHTFSGTKVESSLEHAKAKRLISTFPYSVQSAVWDLNAYYV